MLATAGHRPRAARCNHASLLIRQLCYAVTLPAGNTAANRRKLGVIAYYIFRLERSLSGSP